MRRRRPSVGPAFGLNQFENKSRDSQKQRTSSPSRFGDQDEFNRS